MNEESRRRISEYVRPLAVGLDGVTNYGDVQRVVAASERLADGRDDLDPDLLFLLAVFSGQEKWVSRMGHGSRTEIFLSSLGVPVGLVNRLFRALARFDRDPSAPEEEIVHDALRLEMMGAYGIARSLVEGYQERMDIPEMASAIEKAAATPLRTDAGRRLAQPRREAMLEFARRLRQEHTEFGHNC